MLDAASSARNRGWVRLLYKECLTCKVMAGLRPVPAVFTVSGSGARRRLVGSLAGELRRRKAAARADAEQLRGQIARLLERLAEVEEQL